MRSPACAWLPALFVAQSIAVPSSATLDPALFDLPSDYRPALPQLHGGYDLTRPDTLVNRVQSYWDELTRWARTFFQ